MRPLPPGANVCVVGAGYVGLRIADALKRRGFRVIATARSPESVIALGRSHVAARLDLTDPATFKSIPANVAAVIITAAPAASDPSSYEAIYGTGVGALARHLAGRAVPPRVLYTSSTAVHHVTDGSVVTEDSPVDTSSPKRAALRAGETAVVAPPLHGIVARLGGIYGPGRNRLDDIRFHRLTIEGGENFANTIHVDDAARIALFLLEHGQPGQIYLGVDTEPTPRREVYGWLAGELGLAPPPERSGAPSGRWAENKRCSSAKLQALGYKFRYPTFRDGYRAVIAAEDSGGTE